MPRSAAAVAAHYAWHWADAGFDGPASFIVGNRCGHGRKSLRRHIEPPQHGTRPPVLIKLTGLLERFYSHPRRNLVTLAFRLGMRCMRTERREACIQLLGAMLHYLHLPSMRVCIPIHDDRYMGIEMVWLAAVAGLSLSRADRAMRDLKRAGIVGVYRICEKEKDQYWGKPAIRTINLGLFEVFGLGKQLTRERRIASYNERVSDWERLCILARDLGEPEPEPPLAPPPPFSPSDRSRRKKLIQQLWDALNYRGDRAPPNPYWDYHGRESYLKKGTDPPG